MSEVVGSTQLSSPISRLPPELLVDIFERSLSSRENTIVEPQKHYSDLKGLALVCRLWRQVILSTPGFWQVVTPLPDAPSPSTTLRRSGQGCLLHLIGTLKCFLSDAPALFDARERWHSVTLDVATDDSTQLDSLAEPAPNLCSMVLRDTRIQTRPLQTARYIENLFGNDIPKLRRLGLIGLVVPLVPGLLQNLESLRLVHISSPMNVLNVIMVLFECPDLREFALITWIMPDRTLSGSDTTVARCVHLKRLELDTRHPFSLCQLLRRLDVPACCMFTGESGVHWSSHLVPSAKGVIQSVLDNTFVQHEPLHLSFNDHTFVCRPAVRALTARPSHVINMKCNATSVLRAIDNGDIELRESTAVFIMDVADITVTIGSLSKLSNVIDLRLKNVPNLIEIIKYLSSPQDTMVSDGGQLTGKRWPLPNLRSITLLFPTKMETETAYGAREVFEMIMARDPKVGRGGDSSVTSGGSLKVIYHGISLSELRGLERSTRTALLRLRVSGKVVWHS